MRNFAPEICHNYLLDNAPRELAFDPRRDFKLWQKALRKKLTELVGVMPERVPLNVRHEWEKERRDYREIRLVFTSEKFADVPCHLLIPKTGRPPFPVVICLQGHSSGMHISLGRPKYKGDEKVIKGGDRDHGIRAVGQGYAALVLEQRQFGERKDRRPKKVRGVGHPCHHGTMVALLLGRTMIGERVWDISRAIDVLEKFPEIDVSRVGCMGNSGGGTASYFSACLEPRIKVAMPSCYICTFKDSIGRIDHCMDNYIPGALRYFDMGDLAGLIAPRPLIVVAGRKDAIFPIKGVIETYKTIDAVYKKAGVPESCRLVVGHEGHRFYAKPGWGAFRELSGW